MRYFELKKYSRRVVGFEYAYCSGSELEQFIKSFVPDRMPLEITKEAYEAGKRSLSNNR